MLERPADGAKHEVRLSGQVKRPTKVELRLGYRGTQGPLPSASLRLAWDMEAPVKTAEAGIKAGNVVDLSASASVDWSKQVRKCFTLTCAVALN